ncbi:MAG: ATP-binding cassette domain-containing protein [Burkholderiaceae bacterium]|nr:ATP-binding cassette domain-containing protein [Burkholderiaceae bacterium]
MTEKLAPVIRHLAPGKSTLMKIMAGYIRKNRGTILINGLSTDFSRPDQAMKLGLGMLYQDPLDFPSLTVLDNFMLGQTSGIRNQKHFFQRRLCHLSEQFGFSLNPDAPVKSLTIGERQQLELLRLLALGVEALILDEPTTGISSLQKDTLFNALKALAAKGKSVILVSHKLEDVETLCNRVTVLRQGMVSGNMTRPFSTENLLEMIFGTPPAPPVLSPVVPGSTILLMDASRRSTTSIWRSGKARSLALPDWKAAGRSCFSGWPLASKNPLRAPLR